MKGLKPDTSYVFRVRAQNLTGVGKPSAAFGPVLAQTRTGECHFNRQSEKERETKDLEVCLLMQGVTGGGGGGGVWTPCNHGAIVPQAPKRFMWTWTMTA